MQKNSITLLAHSSVLFLVSLSYVFFIVGSTFAHSTYPESLEKKVSNAIVDIGYDPTSFEAQIPHTFDFELYNRDKSEQLHYTNIWILITRGNETVFATGIKKQELTATTLIYTFPKEGSYTFAVRYQNNDATVAETSFPLTVLAEKNNPSSIYFLIASLTGIGIGILAGVITMKVRKLR